MLGGFVASGGQMRLYAYKPNDLGETSFFVMAETREQADAYLRSHIERRLAACRAYWDGERTGDCPPGIEPHAVLAGVCTVTESDAGVVIENDNNY
jgi:hypothetical protein